MVFSDGEDDVTNLFAGDDRSHHGDQIEGQDDMGRGDGMMHQDEGEGQVNTQEGGTQMNQTANLDMLEGAATEQKKKRAKRTLPKLNAERIMGPRGINFLEHEFKDWKPSGPGQEFQDLDRIMHKMNHWAHRLYPKLPFDETLNILADRLGNKKVVTTHIKKIRLDMVNPVQSRLENDDIEDNDVARMGDNDEFDQFGDVVDSAPPPHLLSESAVDEEREPARYEDGDLDDGREFMSTSLEALSQRHRNEEESISASTVASQPTTSVSSSSGVNEEQLERMRRNKEMALAKRRQRMEQQSSA